MPSVVALTRSAASPSSASRSSQRAACTRCAEASAQNLGAARRAVDDHDARDAAQHKAIDHGARRAAGAEHDRVAHVPIPMRRAGVEIVQKAFDVGIARMQRVVVEPERIGRADGARAIVRLRQRERRLLVRHRDVGADITARTEFFDEIGKLVRRHRFAAVFAGDAVEFEPVIVNERRARMFDWPADDAGGACSRDHASSTTELRSTPICGHSTSIVSPGLSQTGGSTFGPFLTGVPVQMTSPALSVMKLVV